MISGGTADSIVGGITLIRGDTVFRGIEYDMNINANSHGSFYISEASASGLSLRYVTVDLLRLTVVGNLISVFEVERLTGRSSRTECGFGYKH